MNRGRYDFSTSGATFRANGLSSVEHHSASDTLTNNESGSMHTTSGASTTAITFNLPNPAEAGVVFYFQTVDAGTLYIDAGSGNTILTNQGDNRVTYATPNPVGESIGIVADSDSNWFTLSKLGVWTSLASVP